MKKNKGFTLAEVLIALGIVGIIGAVVGPMVNKFKPDVMKIKYLKTYDTLVKVVNALGNNNTIYPVAIKKAEGKTYNYMEIPFYNTEAATLNNGNTTTNIDGGAGKFCRAFAYYGGYDMKACNDQFYEEYNATTFASSSPFVTKNGVAMVVSSKVGDYNSTAGTGLYQTNIFVDLDGVNKGKNCMYSSTCPKPDVFKFIVAANGKVKPADALGSEYIYKRTSYKTAKYEASTTYGVDTCPDNITAKFVDGNSITLICSDAQQGPQEPQEPETPQEPQEPEVDEPSGGGGRTPGGYGDNCQPGWVINQNGFCAPPDPFNEACYDKHNTTVDCNKHDEEWKAGKIDELF